MSLFDSIISEAGEKFGLGKKSGTLLTALLSFMTDQNRGGFLGFLDLFGNAGLEDSVGGWVSSGANTELSNEQLESALGEKTIGELAKQTKISKAKTTSALAFMIPGVVDALTPDGNIPEEQDLFAKIGDYLNITAASPPPVGVSESITANVEEAVETPTVETVPETVSAVSDTPPTAVQNVNETVGNAADHDDEREEANDDGNLILRYMVPLLLLFFMALITWFLMHGASTPVVITNTAIMPNKPVNTNTAATTSAPNTTAAPKSNIDSSFKLAANAGKYTVTGTVKDEETKKQITDSLNAQLGADNVNFDGLKVNANANAFGTGWWDNFAKLLPNLKGWQTGSLAFAGSAITEAAGLPQAAIDGIKSLFTSNTGWKLPVSIIGEAEAAKEANEEAKKQLAEAKTVEQVVTALNASIINFPSGSSDVPADAKPLLEEAAKVLKGQPAATVIQISGHTDSRGSAATNKKVSEARAASIRKALTELGVSEKMLIAKGYGSEKPIASNDTEEGRFQNRRIQYEVLSGTGSTTAAPTTTTTPGANTNAKPTTSGAVNKSHANVAKPR